MKAEIVTRNLKDLKFDPNQSRKEINRQDVKILAEFLIKYKVNNLVEIDENDVIITGEMRTRAAIEAEFEEIDCKLLLEITDSEKAERQLIENLHRTQLTSEEKKKYLQKLWNSKDYSTYTQLGKIVGMRGKKIETILNPIEKTKIKKKIMPKMTVKAKEQQDVKEFIEQDEYEFHELATLFPPMTKEEFDNLKKDIKENGLLRAIILYKGKILDGKNRYSACRELGVELKFKNLPDGWDPLSYVLAENLHRRHLNGAQRADVGLKILEFEGKKAKERQGTRTDLIEKNNSNLVYSEYTKLNNQEKGKARDIVAKKVKVSPSTLTAAKKVKEFDDPEITKAWDDAKSGEGTIKNVQKKIKEKETWEEIKKTREERGEEWMSLQIQEEILNLQKSLSNNEEKLKKKIEDIKKDSEFTDANFEHSDILLQKLEESYDDIVEPNFEKIDKILKETKKHHTQLEHMCEVVQTDKLTTCPYCLGEIDLEKMCIQLEIFKQEIQDFHSSKEELNERKNYLNERKNKISELLEGIDILKEEIDNEQNKLKRVEK